MPRIVPFVALPRRQAAAVMLLGICLQWAPPAPAQAPQEFRSSPLARAFGTAPSIGSPRLSPDGNRLMFLQQDDEGASRLRVLELSTGTIDTPLVGVLSGRDVDWCVWAKPVRLICALADIDYSRSVPAQMTYIAINADGSDLRRLTFACSDGMEPMPDDPQRVFMSCDTGPRYMHLHSGEEDPYDLQDPPALAPVTAAIATGSAIAGGSAVSDGQGRIRLLAGGGTQDYRWYVWREDDWDRFRQLNFLRFDNPFRPVGFGEDREEALHIAWNARTWGLAALNISSLSDREVFSHPSVDITHVDRFGAYPRVVAAAYYFDGPQRFIVDDRVAGVHDFVAEKLPGYSIEVLDESWDQNVYLVRARPPDRAGEFYLIDMADRRLDHIGAEYPHLLGLALAPSRTIEITAVDGGTFSAHLTLPLNRDGPFPAVLIPRGNVSPLDLESPNYLVQFLAFSGYAVLRVNQRGPSAYGGGWTTDRVIVGRQQAADDIDRAGEYLVEAGVAQHGKICGIGSDLGAYAAVMTAVAYPDALQCIVSIRGMLAPRVSNHQVARALNPLLEEPSPVRIARRINAPMLLFDGNAKTDSGNLQTMLHRVDHEAELVAYDHTDQYIGQSMYRIDMLARIGEFLNDRIGQD